jgi:hypothetical protein
MQLKESKTNSHFYLSLVKSFIRLGAAICLTQLEFGWSGILFFIAELIGIAEEL